jgi:glutamate racemase
MNASHSRRLPIGVFDSGVGGLTVLRALRQALPHEDLIYLGDTARLPYGTKSKSSISRYAGQATALLQERGIKLLVVACNTASAVALDTLTEQMKPLPVIGVVEPGATAAVTARPGGRHLVLATEATVRYGAYRQAIARRDERAEVRELACELMVSLAEARTSRRAGFRAGQHHPGVHALSVAQAGDPASRRRRNCDRRLGEHDGRRCGNHAR